LLPEKQSKFLLLKRNKLSTVKIMNNRNLSAPLMRIAAFATILSIPSVTLADTVPAAADTTPATAPAQTAPAETPAAPAAPAPAPAAPETPAAAPADTTASGDRPTTYTMAAGDSLDSIAKKFNTSIRALAALNKIPKSQYRKLRAGKVLQIPPATTDSKK
jgi:nucleoid-associated protein YgaU